MHCKRTFQLGLWIIACLFSASAASAQDEPASRTITSLDFQTQRPVSTNAKAALSPRNNAPNVKAKRNIAIITNSKRRYNFVARTIVRNRASVQPLRPVAVASQKPALKSEELGVTFWRLRPLADADGDVPTFPVKLGDRTVNWAAERVRSSTRFKKGDRVRFTIESSRSGYLYIVDREVYADGSTGDAEIVFPTLRTRSGDNHVSAGTLIEIPASTDSVPYFTIEPRRADYA